MARYVLKHRHGYTGTIDLRVVEARDGFVLDPDATKRLGEGSAIVVEATDEEIAKVRAAASEWLIVEREKFTPAPGGHIPPPGFGTLEKGI